MDQLQLCSFCGSDDVKHGFQAMTDNPIIYCKTCGASGPEGSDSVELARSVWNVRLVRKRAECIESSSLRMMK
jgi:hypothetical protein